jgi:hypothetical protein
MGDRKDASKITKLAECSKPTLESIELARLNRAADLRKEMQEVTDEWIEAQAEARLARWLIENQIIHAPHAVDTATALHDSSDPPSLVLQRTIPSHPQPLRGRRLRAAM